MNNKLLFKFNQQSWTVLKQLMLEAWEVAYNNPANPKSQKAKAVVKSVLKNNEMTFTQWKFLNTFKKTK